MLPSFFHHDGDQGVRPGAELAERPPPPIGETKQLLVGQRAVGGYQRCGVRTLLDLVAEEGLHRHVGNRRAGAVRFRARFDLSGRQKFARHLRPRLRPGFFVRGGLVDAVDDLSQTLSRRQERGVLAVAILRRRGEHDGHEGSGGPVLDPRQLAQDVQTIEVGVIEVLPELPLVRLRPLGEGLRP